MATVVAMNKAGRGSDRGEKAAASLLQVDGVSKTYRLPTGDSLTALLETSLSVAEGEFVSIIGPSGCGKSTLFKLIGGLEVPDGGRIAVAGHPVQGSHQDIGMVFQEESTFPWRTVLENVAFPLEIAGVARREREERAKRVIRLVGLNGFEGRYPAELSGGMRQRTALARTLAAEPKILLMDEPFAALDEQTRLLLGDKILEICRELKQTTLLITHSITEAVQLSDRVAIMSFRPGRILRTVDVKLARPRSSEIVSSPEFGGYVADIWQDLRAEASKGLDAAEAAR